MIIIKEYLCTYKNGKVQIYPKETVNCPACGCKDFYVIGRRERKVIDTGGKKIVVVIRRLRCSKCKTIHHELPDFVVPYKRHCRETIEKIISDNNKGLDCETSTVLRIKTWWNNFQLCLQNKTDFILFKDEITTPSSSFSKVIRSVVNAHLWKHTRLAYSY